MLTDRTEGREAGLGVVEVLLASSILLLASLGCVRATVAAAGAQGRAVTRDRGLVAAYDATEVLRAGGCFTLTGAETPADASAVADRCRAGLRLGARAPIGGGTGSIDDGRRLLPVAFSSRWVGSSPPDGVFGCEHAYYGARPSGIEHAVQVEVREGGRTRTGRGATTIDAAPTDRYDLWSSQRSNLVVAALAGASADLTGAAGVPVRRAADENGCIWFPALTTGVYGILVSPPTGGASAVHVSFTASPGAALVVRS